MATITLPIIHFNDMYNMTDKAGDKALEGGKLTGTQFNTVTRFSEKINAIRAKWANDAKKPENVARVEAAKLAKDAERTEAAKKSGDAEQAEGAKKIERTLEAEHGLVLFSGDLFSPSVESLLTKGRNMVHLMNELAPDACVPGNHEFDFGVERFRQLIEFSNFNWILSNVKEDIPNGSPEDEKAKLRQYCIFECNGLTIGIIGLMSDDTMSKIMDANKKTLKVEAMKEVCLKLSKELRDKGCDIVLALTHAEHDEDIELAEAVNAYKWSAKPNLVNSEGVDAIFGGHNHEYFLSNGVDLQPGSKEPKEQKTKKHDGLLIVKSGYDFRDLSEVELLLVKQPGNERRKYVIESLKVTRHYMAESVSTEDVKESSMWKVLRRQFQNDVARGLEAPVARLREPVSFPGENPREGETAIGNWIADTILEAYNDMGLDDSQSPLVPTIFIMTGGSIRSTSLPKICRTGDIIALLPFISPLVTVEVTGQAIIDALEEVLSGRPPESEAEKAAEKSTKAVGRSSGRFPVVSGIRVHRKLIQNATNPEKSYQLEVTPEDGKGEKLDPGKNYTVLTNSYLVDKNTGFRSFQNPPRHFSSDISMFQALLSYLESVYRFKQIVETITNQSDGTSTDSLRKLETWDDLIGFAEALTPLFELAKQEEATMDKMRPLIERFASTMSTSASHPYLPFIEIKPKDGRVVDDSMEAEQLK